jgi:hypothetical protein
MNQKNVLITIIVLVAAVIGIGFWLSGGGQTGPLSGRMAGSVITVSLDRLTCHVVDDELSGAVLRGTLSSEGVTSLGGKTIEVYREGPSPGDWIFLSSTTTQTDGSFSYVVSFPAISPTDFRVRFPGDAVNLPAEAIASDVLC